MGGRLHSSLAKRWRGHRLGPSGFDLALGQALGRGDFFHETIHSKNVGITGFGGAGRLGVSTTGRGGQAAECGFHFYG